MAAIITTIWLLLLRAAMLEPAHLQVVYGGCYMCYIHNHTPRTKSQNDFCTFRPVIWLLTPSYILLNFYTDHFHYITASVDHRHTSGRGQ